jgi:4-aminobutyrate aminotransferase/(S)-3-amino-2-methylpropionate transaminase
MQAWGAHGGGTIHTATHFGSPPACAAALATLSELRRGRLAARAKRVGQAWMRELALAVRAEGATVRGRGLMVGVVVEGGSGRALAVARGLLGEGYIVLTGGLRGDVLTLTPPLTIHERHLSKFSAVLAYVLSRTPC